MSEAEGWGPRLALILSLVIFSGAVFEPLILGAETTSTVSRASRALNSAPYLPLYLAGLFMVLQSASVLGRLLPVFLPYLLFAAYMGLSLLWSADPLRSLIDFAQLLGTVAVAVGLALSLRPEEVIPLMARVFLILLALSLLFVVFLPGIGRMQTTGFSALNGLPQGVFGHKNQFGEMAALGLALAVAGGSALSLALRIGLVGVSIAGLFLAQSSANLMAVLLALALYLTWRMAQKHASGPSFWLIVMGCVGLAFLLALPGLVGPLLELAGKDATLTGRTYIWTYASELIAARPLLGYGLGSVWTMQVAPVDGFMSFQPSHAHNLALELMLKGGVVALALASVPLVMALWFLTRSGIGEGRLACLFFAVLFTLLLRAPFDAVLFRDNQISFLLLILLHGLATREAQARQSWRQISPSVRATAPLAAAHL